MPSLSCAAAVPTRNRPASLGRLIESLLAQTRRPRQIILIDDGALTPPWRAEWAGRCEKAGVAWLYHQKSCPGRSASRNVAADLADADVVCYFDDDCEPAPDFLAKLLAALESAPGRDLIAVEGRVVRPGGPRPGDRAFSMLLRAAGWWALAPCPKPTRIAEDLIARPVLCGVAAVRREALKSTRFDESLPNGVDYEFAVRLARRGRLARVTDAVCYHHFEPAGRPGSFATGVGLARSYLYSQGKLFGLRGRVAAGAGLIVLMLGELLFGLAGCLLLRRTGPQHLARSAGLAAGLLTPCSPRAD